MVMPFGKYRGFDIEELPNDYLRWLSTRDLYGELYDAVQNELAWRSSFDRVEQSSVSDPALRFDRGDVGLVREIIDRGFKAAARVHHPDAGGSVETMKRLNAVNGSLRAQLERIAS